MPQPLTLDQLKTEAQKQRRRVINHDGERVWRPLQYWKGLPRGTGDYYLFGDKVLATTAMGGNEWYTLR